MVKKQKKILCGVVAGAILVLCGFSSIALQRSNVDAQVEAAQKAAGVGENFYPPEFDRDKAAQKVAADFGLDKDEVKEAFTSNTDFRDIGQAALLAKLSGKSFKSVLDYKQAGYTWPETENWCGVNHEAVKAELDNQISARIHRRFSNVSHDEAKKLLQDGYHPMDIEAASILSAKSGKDVEYVLSLKKINNRWKDVAEELGLQDVVLRGHYDHPCPPDGPFDDDDRDK